MKYSVGDCITWKSSNNEYYSLVITKVWNANGYDKYSFALCDLKSYKKISIQDVIKSNLFGHNILSEDEAGNFTIKHPSLSMHVIEAKDLFFDGEDLMKIGNLDLVIEGNQIGSIGYFCQISAIPIIFNHREKALNERGCKISIESLAK